MTNAGKPLTPVIDNEGNIVRWESSPDRPETGLHINPIWAAVEPKTEDPPEDKKPVPYLNKKPVPYLKCFVHESKVAYRYYGYLLLVIAATGLVFFGLIWVGNTFGDQILSGLYAIRDVIRTVLSAVASVVAGVFAAIPWWGYVLALIAGAPLIYAAIICWLRRISFSGMSVGVIITLFSLVLSAPLFSEIFGDMGMTGILIVLGISASIFVFVSWLFSGD